MSCSIRDSTWNPNGVTVAGLEHELHAPYAVTFPKDYSSMFVADTRHNRVLQYNADFSTFIMIYDGTDTDRKIDGPMAIALTDDGSELIVTSYSDKRVLRWSFVTNSSSLVTASYFAGPTGVAVDQNNTVYVARSLQGSVSSYNRDTEPFWGVAEWYTYDVDGVKHITIVNKFIYMALSKGCRVVKAPLIDFDGTVTIVAGNGRLGSTPYHLRFPWGVAVDPIEEHVFVSDSRNHRIQLCKHNSLIIEFLKIFPAIGLVNATEGITIAGINGRPGVRPNQLNHPHGITLGFDQSLFVADTKNDRIQKFQRYCKI